MTREILGFHVAKHLHIVEHHVRHEIAKRLQSYSTDFSRLVRVEFRTIDDFIEVGDFRVGKFRLT